MFHFLRRGEFLTKEFSGYDQNSSLGQAVGCTNTLALQIIARQARRIWPGMKPISGPLAANGCWPPGPVIRRTMPAAERITFSPTATSRRFTIARHLDASYRCDRYFASQSFPTLAQAGSTSLSMIGRRRIRPVCSNASISVFPSPQTVLPRNGGGSLLTETMPSGQQLFINHCCDEWHRQHPIHFPISSPPWPKGSRAITDWP